MLVLGDVAATIALILAFAASAWSGMLLSALLFSDASRRTSDRLQKSPFGSFLWGLLGATPLFVLGLVFLNLPDAFMKLLGFLVLMVILLMGILGGGGLARWASVKVKENDGSATEYGALAKGAGLAVGACLMPVFGWFFLAPFLLISCVGASLASMIRRQPTAAPAAPTSTQ
jgi:hypothetical protein